MFESSPEFLSVEQDREGKIQKLIPKFGEFPWKVYEEDIDNCNVKHVFSAFGFRTRKKFNCLEGKSLLEHIMIKMENQNFEFNDEDPKMFEE